jgi:hypothetical protein
MSWHNIRVEGHEQAIAARSLVFIGYLQWQGTVMPESL